MEDKEQGIERNLDSLFGNRSLNDEKIDRIWKRVEMKTQKSAQKRSWGWKFVTIVMVLLVIVVLAVGPGKVWAQVRAWLVPNYRPISQLENYEILPEKTQEIHEELTLSLLSVQSLEDELRISILVQGISPVDPEALDQEHFIGEAYLLLKNGERIKSLSGSSGIGDGMTEYVYDLSFPPLSEEAGSELSLVVTDLPYLAEPLKEDWVMPLTVEPVRSEDQVPQVTPDAESYGNPAFAAPESISAESKGIRKTSILIRFDMPEAYEAHPSLAQWWSLQDEDGNFYPMNADLSCSIDCPMHEITMITETGLPKGKTYTLTMPRFGMTKSDYGDFYEEDGITYLPAVLTIDFPESYQAGDFIKIDQWYDIQPISFHLLGVEILHIDDEGLVRFRLVMQSPESANAIVRINLCVNQFVKGGSCGGGSGFGGEKRPQADELIYTEGSFPRELLHGEIGFYIHQIDLYYFTDWVMNFDL
jgi:hypothetical protein